MSNYLRTSYLQHTNDAQAKNSYIELDYYPCDKTKVVLKASLTNTNNTVFLCGCDYDINSAVEDRFCFYIKNHYSYLNYKSSALYNSWAYWGNGVNNNITTGTFGNNYISYGTNNNATIEGEKQTFERLDTPLIFFGSKLNPSLNYTQRVYSLKIYEDDILIIDLVPALQISSNIAGFFDTKSGKFYSNQGTGTVSYGTIESDLYADDNKPIYTLNKNFRINYPNNYKTQSWLSSLNDIFSSIDSEYKKLDTKEINLKNIISTISNKFHADEIEKDGILRTLGIKVSQEEGKSLLSSTLINKIIEDYSKEELESIFGTKEDLEYYLSLVEKDIMKDYHTKQELLDLINLGEGSNTFTDYYKKSEIHELIPEKEDFSTLISSLNLSDYNADIKLFTDLNGKE